MAVAACKIRPEKYDLEEKCMKRRAIQCTMLVYEYHESYHGTHVHGDIQIIAACELSRRIELGDHISDHREGGAKLCIEVQRYEIPNTILYYDMQG